MTRRSKLPLLVWSLVAAACSSSHMGPTLPNCSSATATQVTLAVGGYVSIDPSTDAGCVAFPANASTIDSAEYLVVPQSAAGTPQDSTPYQLGGANITAARFPALERLYAPGPRAARRQVAVQFDRFLRQLGRTYRSGTRPVTQAAPQGAALSVPATITPPVLGSLHTFTVCANLSCSGTGGTKQVTGKVTTVGKRIAVYIDTLAPAGGLDTASLDTLQQAFDTLLFPLDSTNFGPVSDVDSNGVVIVLMTGVVNALVSRSQCESQGFVAGFFYPPDLDPANPQHGEIFYSIVADPDSTLSCAHTAAQLKRDLGGTFIHELQHMINFGQHVLVNKGNEEEGWLDEGLSKYAEEIAGRKYLAGGTHQDSVLFTDYAINDVFDAYEYLSRPDTAYLLIPFDQGNLAEIGASWLFVRYLVDQFGAGLPAKLVQTALTGSGNVVAQTGSQPFATTVSRWALANWVSDLPGFTTPPELSYPSWHFRTRTFPSVHNSDPQDFPLPFPLVPAATAGSAVSLSGMLRSGSGAYARALQGPSAAAFALLFSGGNATAVSGIVTPRLTIIRIR